VKKLHRSERFPASLPVTPSGSERKLLQAFGRRLAHVRGERGFSQKAIACELGIADELISKYERGLHAPKIGTLLRLRTLLAVTLDYLLAGASPAGITDPRLLQWARAANQLSPDQRDLIALSLESMVRAAQALEEREKPGGSFPPKPVR
jgi:transcriptional regulator with XRE-family HTH domain